MALAKTSPDYYDKPLSAESDHARSTYESRLDSIEESIAAEKNPIKRLKLQKQYRMVEYMLSWQGANPKELDFDELKEVCNQPLHEDALSDKYRAKIKGPATAIRAFCIDCQGGSLVAVKDCTSLTCPLWNFRMGKDPLRGYELPPYIDPINESDDTDEDDVIEADEDEEDEDAED
jgi:hypothetical protein